MTLPHMTFVTREGTEEKRKLMGQIDKSSLIDDTEEWERNQDTLEKTVSHLIDWNGTKHEIYRSSDDLFSFNLSSQYS